MATTRNRDLDEMIERNSLGALPLGKREKDLKKSKEATRVRFGVLVHEGVGWAKVVKPKKGGTSNGAGRTTQPSRGNSDEPMLTASEWRVGFGPADRVLRMRKGGSHVI